MDVKNKKKKKNGRTKRGFVVSIHARFLVNGNRAEKECISVLCMFLTKGPSLPLATGPRGNGK